MKEKDNSWLRKALIVWEMGLCVQQKEREKRAQKEAKCINESEKFIIPEEMGKENACVWKNEEEYIRYVLNRHRWETEH